MPVHSRQVVTDAWRLLEPELQEQGYELVELMYGREAGRWVFRVYIDREGGITLGDCQAVSQLLGPVLDAKALVDGSYVLEVSSPGFDRPVRKPGDFERFAGERIKLRSHEPVKGRKRFTGVLRAFRDGLVCIDSGDETYEVHIDNVVRAQLDR